MREYAVTVQRHVIRGMKWFTARLAHFSVTVSSNLTVSHSQMSIKSPMAISRGMKWTLTGSAMIEESKHISDLILIY